MQPAAQSPFERKPVLSSLNLSQAPVSKVGQVTAEPTIAELRGSISPEQQVSAQQRAMHILYKENEGRPYNPTTLKHFANIQAATILRNSGLEGGEVEDSIAYWQSLLDHWEKGEAAPCDPGLSKAEIQQIREALQDCSDFQALYKTRSPDQISALLKSKLEQQKECYLPLGWKGAPGHFMMAKVQAKGDHVIIELLTKGGGAEFHDVVQVGLSKAKPSYKSAPVIIDKEELFNSRSGLSFFTRLISMRDRSLKFNDTSKEIQGADLYGLFNLLATESHEVKPETELRAETGKTPQRSGSCWDTGLRMTIYETLCAAGKDSKRSLYAFKFQTLVDGYRQFRDQLEAADRETCLYLGHAVQEHLTRLAKLYPEILTKDELALGLAIGEEIQVHVQAAEQTLKENAPKATLPELSAGVVDQEAPPVAPSKPIPATSAVSSSQGIVQVPHFSLETPPPAQAVQTIKSWVDQLDAIVKADKSKTLYPEIFLQISMLLETLPITSGEIKDRYWDQVPRAELAACIKNLTDLILLANLTIPEGRQQGRLFTMNSRAYDIACQLAPSIPELRMKNRGFNWAYTNAYPMQRYEKLSFYPDSETIQTLNEIQKNFNKRGERQKGGRTLHLFPFLFTAGMDIQYGRKEGFEHWNYVSQFYTPEIRDRLHAEIEVIKRRAEADDGPVRGFLLRRKDQIPEPEALFIEDREQNYFPPPYYDLQKLAYLSIPHPSESQRKIQEGIRKGALWDICSYKSSIGMDKNVEMKIEGKTEDWVDPKLKSSKALERFVISSKYQRMGENNILVEQPELTDLTANETLSRHTLEELALVTVIPERQVPAALDWGLANLRIISNPAVQGCLEEYLFEYGLLTNALEKERRATFEKIHDFLLAALDLYEGKPSEQQTVLWLTKIGSRLEEYLLAVPLEGKEIELPDFHAILSEMLAREDDPSKKIVILNHMILTLSPHKPEELSERDIGALLYAKFKLQLLQGHSRTDNSESGIEAQYIFYKHREPLRDFLAKITVETRNSILNELLGSLMSSSSTQLDWKVVATETSLKFVAGQYTIDLDNFQVLRDNILVRELAAQVANSHNYQSVFGKETFVFVQRDGCYYKLPDEKARVIEGKNGIDFRVQKKMTVNGIEKWFEYEPSPVSSLKDLPIPKAFCGGEHQFWRAAEPPYDVLLVDKQSGRFEYDYQSSMGWISIDPATGRPSNERVVNLISPESPRQDWIQFLARFEPLDEIILKEKRREDGSWEISTLHFPRLELTFTATAVDGQLRLKSDQFEGYYIVLQSDNAAINGLQGAFQLEDRARKQQMMIIPAKGIVESAPIRTEDPNSDFGAYDQDGVGHEVQRSRVVEDNIFTNPIGLRDRIIKQVLREEAERERLASENIARPTEEGIASQVQHEDGSGQTILVPASSASASAKPILAKAEPSLPVEFDHANLLITGARPYLVYHGVPDGKLLKPESPRAALYLSLLLRNLGEYSLSRQYLAMSEHMDRNDEIDWKFVEQLVIERRLHYSPSLAALDLHLASRMDAHEKKHTKMSFESKDEASSEDSVSKIRNNFKAFAQRQTKYYQATSSDLKEDVTAIPADLRLTSRQQQTLATPKGGRRDIREEFAALQPPTFCAPNQSFSDWLKSTPIEEVSSARAKYNQQTDVVRLLPKSGGSAFEYTSSLFFDLYNRACSSDPQERKLLQLDLFFLSRNDDTEKEKLHFLIGTLAFVADHFQNFRPVTITQEPFMDFYAQKRVKAEKEKFFEGVLKTCVDLQESKGDVIASKDESSIISRPDVLRTQPIPRMAIPEIQISLENQLQDVCKAEHTPLGQYFSKYFIREESKPVDAPFPLEGIKPRSPLSEMMVSNFREGHKLNKEASSVAFRLVAGSDVSLMQSELSQDLEDYNAKVKDLSAEIEVLANKLPSGDLQLLSKTKQLGKQVRHLSLEEPLLSCFLSQDTRTLLEWNPHLTESDVLEIFKKTTELLLAGRHVKLAEEALRTTARIMTAAEKERDALIGQLGKIMNSRTAYNVEKNPEYLAYEYATGMVLRDDQVKLLDWIFDSLEKPELEHLLFQFEAGGGKTKVLMPIIAFKLTQKGKFPVLINHAANYEIGKSDLDRSLTVAFKQRLEVLEIELGTNITAGRLWSILDSLKLYHSDKKCLSVKSETINALLVARKMAFEGENPQMIDAINELFKFFKQNGVALIDEAHLTLDSLQETNQATGKPESLSPNYQLLLITLTSMLAGTTGELKVETPTGPVPIQDKVRLLQNQQALLTDQDLVHVRNALARAVIEHPPLSTLAEIPLFDRISSQELMRQLSDFLMEVKDSRPVWLEQLYSSGTHAEKDLANTIVLAKKFLHQLMPHTLRLIQGISYGDSIHPGDFTCAPRHDKKPVASKFQDVMVTAALTVQNVLQTGLSESGMKQVMEILIKEHEDEKSTQNNPNILTAAQALLNEWWGNGAPSLDTLDVNRESDIKPCLQKLGHHPAVIDVFLKHIALPQISTYKQKLSVTPPDLLDAFGKTIAFSATPGTLELYPHQMQKTDAARFDPGFEASVLQVLYQPENQTIIPVAFDCLDTLFEEIYARDPASLERVTSLIDAGGLFRSCRNKDVVETFLRFAEQKGIQRQGAIFKEDLNEGISEGNLALLQFEQNQPVFRALVGSDLPSALQQIGKNFNDLVLVTLFGLEDTTGADYKQPDTGKALLTVGEGQTKTKTIQAAMRMRRLLQGKNGQTLNWLITQELANQIPREKQDQMTIQDLFAWMIDNEAQLLEKAIVMRAFQGIRHLVQKTAWNDILSQQGGEQQIARYKHFRNGLVDHIEADPYMNFVQMTKEKTEDVLKNYALACYRALGFDDTDLAQLSEEDRQAYQLLVAQTQNLVSTIQTGPTELSGEMFQNQEVRQEQKQEQRQEVEQQALYAKVNMAATKEQSYSTIDMWSSKFLTDSYLREPANQHHRLKEMLGLDVIPDDVYISDAFFDVQQMQSQAEQTRYIADRSKPKEITPTVIRPFKYVLVIQEKGPNETVAYKYLPCSQAAAQHFLEQLDRQSTLFSKGSRKAVMVDVKGGVVKNGNGNLGLNAEELQVLRDSAEFKKHNVLLSFLNGRIQNLTLLHEITSKLSDEQLDAAWKKIVDMKIGERPPDHKMFQELKRMRGGKAAAFPKVSVSVSSTSSRAKPQHSYKLRQVSSRESARGSRSKTSLLSRLRFWK